MPDGLLGGLILLGVCLIAHESWRWAGLALGRNLSVDSAVFRWVQLVATALVAALVMRLVVFPAGLLAEVVLWIRLAAVVMGLGAYFATGQSLAAGVATGAVGLWALVTLIDV
ncbi:MAG: AzlD domain-containing protein [Pseudomonadota bacterium]